MKTIGMSLGVAFLISIALVSCDGKQGEEGSEQSGMEMHQQQMSETYVDTMTLRRTSFNKQIVCNGRLRAQAKSELNFTSQGVIADVRVCEGQRVAKGTLIATLDKTEKLREVKKAEHELERAKVELTDKLIGLGYDDWQSVPADVMQRAEVTTGYYSAKYQLQTAKKALEECSLYAPFSGRVANLDAKRYQRNEKICTLVDDSRFEVEFQILEAELAQVRKGQRVQVSPFVADTLRFSGTVSEINPLVDDKGLVKIRAVLGGSGDRLLDGMNVRVVVEEKVQNMFVVPKDAVVERDGYHVIFLLEDSRAVWTYVDVIHSNISSFAITGCQRKETTIKDGDIVITSGNLNLADGTEVRIANE
ncbi:MAG: efflux RND transporter periplasmic adaptor subunit [Bacteroidaceae bacterium]|nr:efflux RND transporter periplasmic adaptor subunit [Bacteroidaceae bacterium]